MEHQYLFRFESPLEHYTADAFVIRCFDNRFWKVFKRFMKVLGFAHIDPESVAGGAKVLASPEEKADQKVMLKQLEKSIQLHGVKKVLLFTHHDCGAYGGFNNFKSRDDELNFHKKEHQKAKEVILGRFPSMPIETYFIDEHGILKTNA